MSGPLRLWWLVAGLARPLSWEVRGPFASEEEALQDAHARPPRPRWVIVQATTRRQAVLAAHRAVGLLPPPAWTVR
jgi:hypothetical protein